MTEISPWGGKTWSKGMIISKYLGVENKCVSTYVMAIEGIPQLTQTIFNVETEKYSTYK